MRHREHRTLLSIALLVSIAGCSSNGVAPRGGAPALVGTGRGSPTDDARSAIAGSALTDGGSPASVAPPSVASPADAGPPIDVGPAGCVTRVLGQSGGASLSSCARSEDCALTTVDCCAPCGVAAEEDVRAVSKKTLERNLRPFCKNPNAGCPGCAGSLPSSLGATCEKGRCVVTIDECTASCPVLRPPTLLARTVAGSAAKCSKASDCIVAHATCCACGEITNDDAIGITLVGRADRLGECEKSGCSCAGRPNAALVPDCVDGVCRVRDTGLDSRCGRAERIDELPKPPVPPELSCKTDDQCTFEPGCCRGCCDCGGGGAAMNVATAHARSASCAKSLCPNPHCEAVDCAPCPSEPRERVRCVDGACRAERAR